MSVNIEIKQKGLFKKKITVPEIAELENLSYGIADGSYRLVPGEVGQYTILYNLDCIGRGIEVSIENDNVNLRLNLPTIPKEIKLFYRLTERICEKLKLKEFYRDEEKVNIKDAGVFYEPDKAACERALSDITHKIKTQDTKEFYIFGAMNPIALGIKEVETINGSLEAFEKFLTELQQRDIYYAVPRFYKQQDESVLGVYYVGENVVSAFPYQPKLPFIQIQDVANWYAMLPENNILKYEDFIHHVEKQDDYDASRFVIQLSKEKIEELVSAYKTEL
ncbi:MAG: DUF4299 family protein [Roseburia sp.]|nr:DUF4299 family protein [Roseburia sp.]